MNKICNFYINDAHLSVVLFEYIKKQVDSGTKIIVVSQDTKKMRIRDLKNKFNNIKVNSKIDFLTDENIDKLYNNENINIVIKGDKEFISKVESNFNRLIKKEKINVDILSCYNIKDSNISEISNNYDQILNTNGIYNLSKDRENNLQKI